MKQEICYSSAEDRRSNECGLVRDKATGIPGVPRDGHGGYQVGRPGVAGTYVRRGKEVGC